MKSAERILLPLLIIFPIFFLGFFPAAPRPVKLVLAWQRARLAETFKNPAKAAAEYRHVLVFLPERLDLYRRIADLDFAAGNYSAAVEAYQTAQQNGVMSAVGWLNLGEAYQKTGDLISAEKSWASLASVTNVEPGVFAEAAQRLRSSGDLEDTLIVAQRWMEEDPGSTQAAWLVGMILSPRDLTRSAQALEIAAVGDGTESEMARSLLDVLSQAAAQTDRAYQVVLIGQRLADLGQWDAAEKAFHQATINNPDYAEAWALLGETRQHLGKDGWTDLLRAKSLAPNSDIVLSALSLYWNRQNEPKVALAYLRKLADKHPTEGKWQIEIGSTLAQAGDLVAAMAAYQKGVSIEPENDWLWRSLAVFSATYGFDFDTFSRPAIERALALAPRDAEVLDAAGWIFLQNSDLKSAEQFLQQSLAVDGGLAAARLHLGQVYLAGNKNSLALPLLKSAAAQTQDPATARQAQRLLEKNFPSQ